MNADNPRHRYVMATLDALRWLGWHHTIGDVKTAIHRRPSGRENIYHYDVARELSEQIFAVTFYPDGRWALVVPDSPAMAWFTAMPWTRIEAHGPKLDLYCPRMHMPNDAETLPGMALPEMIITIEGTPAAAKLLDGDALWIGTYSADTKMNVKCEFARTVPFSKASGGRR